MVQESTVCGYRNEGDKPFWCFAMLIQYIDFNGSDRLFSNQFLREWQSVEAVLQAVALHVKKSDQANIQGTLIFDPVGMNGAIKDKASSGVPGKLEAIYILISGPAPCGEENSPIAGIGSASF